MLGYDGDTGGIPVQSVIAAENEGLMLLLEIPGQSIGQRVIPCLLYTSDAADE